MRRSLVRSVSVVVPLMLGACAAPSRPPALAAADVLPVASPTSAAAYRVFFELDSDALTADAAETLERAAQEYQRIKPVRLVLAGHADRSGRERYNRGLSGRRAAATRDYLVGAGVPPEALTIEARGEREGLVDTPDGSVEPQNRRVEIFVRPG